MKFMDEESKKLYVLIKQMGDKIMSAIQDFAKKQNEYNEQMDLHLNALKADFDLLNQKIFELQDSPMEISDTDKEVLETLSLYAKGVVDRLRDLDELTPPAIPVE